MNVARAKVCLYKLTLNVAAGGCEHKKIELYPFTWSIALMMVSFRCKYFLYSASGSNYKHNPFQMAGQANLILLSNLSRPKSIQTAIFHGPGRGKLVSCTYSSTAETEERIHWLGPKRGCEMGFFSFSMKPVQLGPPDRPYQAVWADNAGPDRQQWNKQSTHCSQLHKLWIKTNV